MIIRCKLAKSAAMTVQDTFGRDIGHTVPSKYPLINSRVPSLEDCEIFTDEGHPVEGVIEFVIEAKPAYPIIAILKVVVREMDIGCVDGTEQIVQEIHDA